MIPRECPAEGGREGGQRLCHKQPGNRYTLSRGRTCPLMFAPIWPATWLALTSGRIGGTSGATRRDRARAASGRIIEVSKQQPETAAVHVLRICGNSDFPSGREIVSTESYLLSSAVGRI
jgi:hypothetical protein